MPIAVPPTLRPAVDVVVALLEARNCESPSTSGWRELLLKEGSLAALTLAGPSARVDTVAASTPRDDDSVRRDVYARESPSPRRERRGRRHGKPREEGAPEERRRREEDVFEPVEVPVLRQPRRSSALLLTRDPYVAGAGWVVAEHSPLDDPAAAVITAFGDPAKADELTVAADLLTPHALQICEKEDRDACEARVSLRADDHDLSDLRHLIESDSAAVLDQTIMSPASPCLTHAGSVVVCIAPMELPYLHRVASEPRVKLDPATIINAVSEAVSVGVPDVAALTARMICDERQQLDLDPATLAALLESGPVPPSQTIETFATESAERRRQGGDDVPSLFDDLDLEAGGRQSKMSTVVHGIGTLEMMDTPSMCARKTTAGALNAAWVFLPSRGACSRIFSPNFGGANSVVVSDSKRETREDFGSSPGLSPPLVATARAPFDEVSRRSAALVSHAELSIPDAGFAIDEVAVPMFDQGRRGGARTSMWSPGIAACILDKTHSSGHSAPQKIIRRIGLAPTPSPSTSARFNLAWKLPATGSTSSAVPHDLDEAPSPVDIERVGPDADDPPTTLLSELQRDDHTFTAELAPIRGPCSVSAAFDSAIASAADALAAEEECLASAVAAVEEDIRAAAIAADFTAGLDSARREEAAILCDKDDAAADLSFFIQPAARRNAPTEMQQRPEPRMQPPQIPKPTQRHTRSQDAAVPSHMLSRYPQPIQPPTQQLKLVQQRLQSPNLDLHMPQNPIQPPSLQQPRVSPHQTPTSASTWGDGITKPSEEWVPAVAVLNASRDIINARRATWADVSRGLRERRGGAMLTRETPGLNVDLTFVCTDGAVAAATLVVPEYCENCGSREWREPRINFGHMASWPEHQKRCFQIALELVSSISEGFAFGVVVFEGDQWFRSLTEPFMGMLKDLVRGSMNLQCVSCDPSQTAEILLRIIAPPVDAAEIGKDAMQRYVIMPAEVSESERDFSHVFPLLNPISANLLIAKVRDGGFNIANAVMQGQPISPIELAAVAEIARCPSNVLRTSSEALQPRAQQAYATSQSPQTPHPNNHVCNIALDKVPAEEMLIIEEAMQQHEQTTNHYDDLLDKMTDVDPRKPQGRGTTGHRGDFDEVIGQHDASHFRFGAIGDGFRAGISEKGLNFGLMTEPDEDAGRVTGITRATHDLISNWWGDLKHSSALEGGPPIPKHQWQQERQLSADQSRLLERQQQLQQTASWDQSRRESAQLNRTPMGALGGRHRGPIQGDSYPTSSFAQDSTVANPFYENDKQSGYQSPWKKSEQQQKQQRGIFELHERGQEQVWRGQQQMRTPMVTATGWGGVGGGGGIASRGTIAGIPQPPRDPTATPRWGTPEKLRGMKRKQAKSYSSKAAGGTIGDGGGSVRDKAHAWFAPASSPGSGTSDATWGSEMPSSGGGFLSGGRENALAFHDEGDVQMSYGFGRFGIEQRSGVGRGDGGDGWGGSRAAGPPAGSSGRLGVPGSDFVILTDKFRYGR